MLAGGIDADLIRRYAAPVPRYTSYPTANHFSDSVAARDFADWMAALPAGPKLSLYVHIPFCNTLCWYCACHTRAVRRYGPIQDYLEALEAEIATAADLLPRHRVAHIHWGGGSPNMLEPRDIERLAATLRARFAVADEAELAVEVDPRLVTASRTHALAAAGVNRISLGVQDFDPAVQAAIGRPQSFEETQRAIDGFRAAGIASINIDLVYGLPRQTLASAARTLQQVLSLAPERLAIFGYAHLPQRMRNQRLIDAAELPGPALRLAMQAALAEQLVAAGYRAIGIDHFASPGDALAEQPVHRNFQGYTTDRADALIGLGASAISQLPDGYAQNAAPVNDYARRVRANGLATARGIRLSESDRVRRAAIERLMCEFRFAARELEMSFGGAAKPLSAIARSLGREAADGLIEWTADGFRVTERGRPFVRAICARFDAYLAAGERRHSLAV